jgi:phosphatidylserine synthase
MIIFGVPVAVLLFYYCILRLQIWSSLTVDRAKKLHFRAFVLSASASVVMAALGLSFIDYILVFFLLPAFGFAAAAVFHWFWYDQYRRAERGKA